MLLVTWLSLAVATFHVGLVLEPFVTVSNVPVEMACVGDVRRYIFVEHVLVHGKVGPVGTVTDTVIVYFLLANAAFHVPEAVECVTPTTVTGADTSPGAAPRSGLDDQTAALYRLKPASPVSARGDT